MEQALFLYARLVCKPLDRYLLQLAAGQDNSLLYKPKNGSAAEKGLK